MPYVIDRRRGLRTEDVVVVLSVRQRRARARVVLRDNGLHRTLTRPGTLVRRFHQYPTSLIAAATVRRPRQRKEGRKHTTWGTQEP